MKKIFLLASGMLLSFFINNLQAQNDIPAWDTEDIKPTLTGNPSLSINLDPSRLQAVVPAGIFFKHDGPLTDNYYWNFGNGITERGSQASHVYETPGTYTVEVIRVDPETNAWGSDQVVIEVTAFTGATYYIDSVNGNDNNLGTDPSIAWKTTAKVRSFLSNGTQTNQRFLFKRGQTFPVVGAQLAHLTRSNLLRFGAYANNNGSDDPQQTPPVLVVNSDGLVDETSVVVAFAVNQDLAFSDMKFLGDYEFVPPPNDPTTRHDYKVNTFDLLDLKSFVSLRVEISHLKNGVYFQRDAKDYYIHDCNIHHVQVTPVFGNAVGYSLRNNRLTYSAQSHIHYVGADEAVIRDNVMVENGVSVQVGRDPWFQCGLRLNSSSSAQTRRVYISRNNIKQMTGQCICVGQNDGRHPNSVELVVEENIFNGNPTEANYYWESGPTIGFQSTQDLTFRNNAIINARTGVAITRNGAVSRNHQYSHNTIHMSRTDLSAFEVNGANGDVEDFFIENNILVGSNIPITLRADDFDQEMFLSDNIFWNDGNKMELNNNGVFTDITNWSTAAQGDNNVELDPDFLSLDPEHENFIKPNNSSQEMRTESELFFNDFTGTLRSLLYIGAREGVDNIIASIDNATSIERPVGYPNPFKENTTVVIPESLQGKAYTLTNLQGQLILSGKSKGNIEINQLDQGVYFLKIEGTSSLRLVKF